MTIDPQITAALIAGVATIAAVVIGWWLHEKKSQRKPSVAPKSIESDSNNSSSIETIFASLETDANKDKSAERTLTTLSKVTVKEVVESINSAPPFQKEQIASQYKGIAVKWTGHLKEVLEDPRDKESVLVNLTINQDTFVGNSFWFSEKVAKFPEIRTLKRGSAISVLGEILSASGPGLCVNLRPIAIEVIENHV